MGVLERIHTEENLIRMAIESKKPNVYTDEREVSEAEALGLLVAGYFEWTGLDVLKLAYYALEDSNFHTVNETIAKLIRKLEREFKIPKEKRGNW